MKKLILLVAALCFGVSLAFAQGEAQSTTLTLKGDIIDNQCAGTQTAEQLAAFVKTHTKECALLPACAASGYSILADGQLLKFDKESNAKVSEFLSKADSKLQVAVEAEKVGEELSLVSIKNQE
jgi:phosphoribosylamine-glycine ligase